jgi:site-specific DNA recombinase
MTVDKGLAAWAEASGRRGAKSPERAGLRFAFYGRVSTEDWQEPESSLARQRAQAEALVRGHGWIVARFCDVGESRTVAWGRRPQAAALVAQLADPGRGWDAVVVGEYERAFYGSQYAMVAPLLQHYGVQLWMPESGGRIDFASEHDEQAMTRLGLSSKREIARTSIRVRTAMATQTRDQGRYLGGRPPYGYRLGDAGPHPNKAHAAWGRRAHRLEPDPETAHVVRWVFAQRLAGHSVARIARALNEAEVPCPSAADPGRNPHRPGTGWTLGTVTTILANPRYTGRQVWNRQRKAEILLDIDNVADGYETKLKWNKPGDWIWSEQIAHEPLIEIEQFEAVQARIAARAGHGPRLPRENLTTTRPCLLRGLLFCGVCGRKMQGNYNNGTPYYRCRYLDQYATANHIHHPRTIYLRQDAIIPKLDAWLATAFAPHNLSATVEAMAAASGDADERGTAAADAEREQLDACNLKLTRYRALLDEGTDPAIVAGWIREVEAERLAIQARLRTATRRAPMTADEITALGDMIDILARAEPADKIKIYTRLGLRMTHDINANAIDVTAHPLGRDNVVLGLAEK